MPSSIVDSWFFFVRRLGFNEDGREVVFTAAVTKAPIGDGLFARTVPSLTRAGDDHRLIGIDVNKVFQAGECVPHVLPRC